MASIKDLAEKTVGPIRSMLADVAAQGVAPEKTKLDHLRWEIVVDQTGTITTTASNVAVRPGHVFAARKVTAYMQEASSLAASLVTVNLEEDGSNATVFRSDINLASLIADGGPCAPMEWQGMYRFREGAVISPSFTVDATRWANLVGAERIVGFVMLGTTLDAQQLC